MEEKTARRSAMRRIKLLMLTLSLSGYSATVNAQQCSKTSSCGQSLCCSQYGWCGATAEYCLRANNCQSRCWQSPLPGAPFRRMTYYPSWSEIAPTAINSTLFTHIVYAFAAIDRRTNTVVPGDPATEAGPTGKWAAFTAGVKQRNRKVKALLSIGGGDPNATAAFRSMASSAARRQAFISSGISTARSYGFDGLDLDWELPNGPGDRTNFVLLLGSFRAAILQEAKSSGRPALLLSAAVSAYGPDIALSYVIPAVDANLDWVDVMCYDFHGSWDDVTGEPTALADPSNVDTSCTGALQAWLGGGLNPSRFVVGLASYGATWTLASARRYGIGAKTVGPGTPGPATQEAGILSYGEIKKFIASGAAAVFDVTTSSMYAHKGRQWVGYDNPKTITLKAKFARQYGLGGYAFWAHNLDSNDELAAAAFKV